jgi:hypothetical protein
MMAAIKTIYHIVWLIYCNGRNEADHFIEKDGIF